MRFRTKIWMLPLCAGALFLLGVVLSYSVGAKTSALLQEIRTVDAPAVVKLQQVLRGFEAFKLTLQTAASEGDVSSLDKLDEVTQQTHAYLSELSSLDGREELGAKLRTDFDKYADASLGATRALLSKEAAGDKLKRMQVLQLQLSDLLAASIGAASATLQDREAAADHGVRLATWVSLGTGIVVLLALAMASHLIVNSVWRDLGEDPGVLREAVSRVAAGDLSQKLPAVASDSESILAGVVRMQTSLAQVVTGVLANCENMASASAEIAQGNQDLSQRTEHQASALQQTSGTMAELASTVVANAEGAQQANSLAQAASEVAVQGGMVVGQVVGTMRGISQSSRRIGDITGVIDGIAFQTNILALNAAVEAARAGDQGRGFAVVAGEVRTLAQRSAAAAKEIRSLIAHNVTQVEQGAVLADQAGKTMEEIVLSIKGVSTIVAEISAASTEQSRGIHQVGEAVGQMDQVTQQNAALVEQSAAAAESLKSLAQEVVRAIGFFKTINQMVNDRTRHFPSTATEAAQAQISGGSGRSILREPPSGRIDRLSRSPSFSRCGPATHNYVALQKKEPEEWESF